METGDWFDMVGSWVWRASWQASVLTLIVLAIQWLLRSKLTPAWRSALWLVVIARLCVPSGWSSAWSVFNYATIDHVDARALNVLLVWPENPVSNADGQRSEESRFVAKEFVAPASLPQSVGAGPPLWRAELLKRACIWMWLAGVVLLAVRLAWNNYRFARKLRGRRPLEIPGILAVLDECRNALRLRRRLPVFEAADVDSPALFGCFRLRLLLPPKIHERFSPAELRHIFLHELAHVRRRDVQLNWVTTVLQILHWFNPVLWLAFQRMRADRELACDALALAHGHPGDHQAYGATIIKLLEQLNQPRVLTGMVGILEDKKQMKQRLKMIADFSSRPQWSILAMVITAVFAAVALSDAQEKTVPSGVSAKRPEAAAETQELRPPEPLASTATKPPVLSGMTLRRLVTLPGEVLLGSSQMSPDGRYLAYWKNDDGGIAVYEFASQASRDLCKGSAGFRFSGDSTQAAFVEGKQLRAVPLRGGEPRTIFQDDKLEIRLLAWSPDNRWLAIEIDRGNDAFELGLVNEANGALRVLNANGARSVGRAAFSKDSRFLIFDLPDNTPERKSDIFAMPVEGGTEIPLVVHRGNDHLLGVVPGSNHILFSSDRRGTHDAWTIEFGEGKVQRGPELIKADLGRIDPLGFSPTGALFFSLRHFTSDVYTLRVDPQTCTALGPPTKTVERFEGSNSASDWSPDGRYLAYNSDRSPPVLCVWDTETQQERVLAEGVFGPKWSPDGKSILVFSGWGAEQNALYRLEVTSGKRSAVVTGKNFYRRCEWSRDGSAIYYQYDAGTNGTPIVRRNLETGEEKVIHQRHAYYFALSPDGRHLAIRGPKINQIQLIPATGGDPKPLVQFGGGYYIPGWDTFCWSADSRFVLVCKWLMNLKSGDPGESIKSEMMRVPIDGGPAEVVIEMPRIRYPSVHPDKTRISFSAGRPRVELWVMEDFLPRL